MQELNRGFHAKGQFDQPLGVGDAKKGQKGVTKMKKKKFQKRMKEITVKSWSQINAFFFFGKKKKKQGGFIFLLMLVEKKKKEKKKKTIEYKF